MNACSSHRIARTTETLLHNKLQQRVPFSWMVIPLRNQALILIMGLKPWSLMAPLKLEILYSGCQTHQVPKTLKSKLVIVAGFATQVGTINPPLTPGLGSPFQADNNGFQGGATAMVSSASNRLTAQETNQASPKASGHEVFRLNFPHPTISNKPPNQGLSFQQLE